MTCTPRSLYIHVPPRGAPCSENSRANAITIMARKQQFNLPTDSGYAIRLWEMY